MPDPEPVSGNTKRFSLAPGYYRALYTASRCIENFREFVVLPSHQRNIAIRYDWAVAIPPKRLPNGEFSITVADRFNPPVGAVAGAMHVQDHDISLISRADAKRLTPNTGGGAYYFDEVPPGRYNLEYFNESGRHTIDVLCLEYHATIVDL